MKAMKATKALTSAVLAALFGAGTACASVAAAAPGDEQGNEPPPPAQTGLIPPLSAIGSILAQSGSEPAGPLGLPDLSAYAPGLLLAQNAAPAPPGQPSPVVVPNLSAFDPAYLVPQNLAPALPGAGQAAPGIGPGTEDPGTGRVAFLRRIHEMYEAGLLRGALLGQAPAGTIPEPPG